MTTARQKFDAELERRARLTFDQHLWLAMIHDHS
jgi:hypothetical protein